MRYTILITLLAFSTAGCIDARIKRASSALVVATAQAKKDRDNAKTEAERKAIDDMYFQQAPRMAQLVDDYLNGRTPQDLTTPAVIAPAPVVTVASKGYYNGNNRRTKLGR